MIRVIWLLSRTMLAYLAAGIDPHPVFLHVLLEDPQHVRGAVGFGEDPVPPLDLDRAGRGR